MTSETLNKPKYSITLTDAAVAKVMQLLEHEKPGVGLRVAVQPGGCSGLRYQLYFTDEYAKVLAMNLAQRLDEGFAEPDDEETADQRAVLEREAETLVWFDWFAIIIDRKSGPYLDNAIIDYVDTIQEQGFKIDNPNAQGSCACGDSFH